MPDRSEAILTLDVEDWEHANFSQLRDKGPEIQSLVRSRKYAMDANTDLWIELLEKNQAKSTCFILGEFARRYPQAVRRLQQAGHEIASHGDTHDLVYEMSRERFREFLKRGLAAVAEITGNIPIGFRAPSWSVDFRTPWFCEELAAQGIRYDSSEFPVRTPLFGSSGGSLKTHHENGVFRIPVSVLTLGPLRFPFASGAFFRLSPLPMIRWGLKAAIRKERVAMVVLHPRELDENHPRLPLSGLESSVHYAQLNTTISKLTQLLKEFSWLSISNIYRTKLDTSGLSSDN